MRKYNISFGKSAPDAPKDARGWYWRCDCGCGAVNGPFKTLKAAEKDAEDTIAFNAALDVADEIYDETFH